jgi:hypothetical protein
MREHSNMADFYRQKEQHRKAAARRPVSEKLATASRLRDVQEKLARIRAANKAKTNLSEKVNIPIKPNQE